MCDSEENGPIDLLYMPTEDTAADVFTNGTIIHLRVV
jgi:hypothetical protein